MHRIRRVSIPSDQIQQDATWAPQHLAESDLMVLILGKIISKEVKISCMPYN